MPHMFANDCLCSSPNQITIACGTLPRYEIKLAEATANMLNSKYMRHCTGGSPITGRPDETNNYSKLFVANSTMYSSMQHWRLGCGVSSSHSLKLHQSESLPFDSCESSEGHLVDVSPSELLAIQERSSSDSLESLSTWKQSALLDANL